MPDKIAKFIASLDKKAQQRLKAKLESIKNNPLEGNNIKKLNGFGEKIYRVRIGKIRIIYQVINNAAVILDIDYRGNIY